MQLPLMSDISQQEFTIYSSTKYDLEADALKNYLNCLNFF